MPYIKATTRRDYDALITLLITEIGRHKQLKTTGNIVMGSGESQMELPVGDINYIISRILWALFDEYPSYRRINDIIGLLECIKLEFDHRRARDYEFHKLVENGDLSNPPNYET